MLSHWPLIVSPYSSPSLNLTSEWFNPLIGRNITWTNEMVADLRRGYNQAKTFISTCLWVSIQSLYSLENIHPFLV